MQIPAWVRSVVAVVSVGVLACGCGPDGQGSAAPVDEATPPFDEGAPPVDEATPPFDEGAPPIDEGAPPVDEATPPFDEGVPPTDEGAAVGGAEALGGPRITSLDDLATWIQTATGSCADARTDDGELADTLDDIYEDTEDEPFLQDITPLVAGVGECTVDHPDGSTMYVEMVLFEEGSFTDVQQVWKAHSTERPPDSWALFGNGYTLHGIEDRPDTAAALGVMYLRCGENDGLGGQQMPADVAGCFFTSIR